jgi:hypothetical protein
MEPNSKLGIQKSQNSFICSILDSVKEPGQLEVPEVIQEEDQSTGEGENNEPSDAAGANVVHVQPVISAANSAFIRVHPNSTKSMNVSDKVSEAEGPVNGEQMEPLNVQVEDADVVVDSIVLLFRNLYTLIKDREANILRHM